MNGNAHKRRRRRRRRRRKRIRKCTVTPFSLPQYLR
jgi:hypothetical protein